MIDGQSVWNFGDNYLRFRHWHGADKKLSRSLCMASHSSTRLRIDCLGQRCSQLIRQATEDEKAWALILYRL